MYTYIHIKIIHVYIYIYLSIYQSIQHIYIYIYIHIYIYIYIYIYSCVFQRPGQTGASRRAAWGDWSPASSCWRLCSRSAELLLVLLLLLSLVVVVVVVVVVVALVLLLLLLVAVLSLNLIIMMMMITTILLVVILESLLLLLLIIIASWRAELASSRARLQPHDTWISLNTFNIYIYYMFVLQACGIGESGMPVSWHTQAAGPPVKIHMQAGRLRLGWLKIA